jgi:hypothetical protein
VRMSSRPGASAPSHMAAVQAPCVRECVRRHPPRSGPPRWPARDRQGGGGYTVKLQLAVDAAEHFGKGRGRRREAGGRALGGADRRDRFRFSPFNSALVRATSRWNFTQASELVQPIRCWAHSCPSLGELAQITHETDRQSNGDQSEKNHRGYVFDQQHGASRSKRR